MSNRNFGVWEEEIHFTFNDNGEVIEYKAHLYRQQKDWYDEIRYESHERRGSKKIIKPHIHIKLGTSFKPNKETIKKELSEIIEKIIPKLEDIIK
ncbi:hypothetical protein DRJ19_02595 [Candidatus Woesearchaeota archaeon]|nr:MAG: hypothetical protein DRJ19_02595 [Candidatus Woesearchaeota archaeon]